jgi:2-keto-3-deoxy-L-rhamnonate aldolase RhmA
VDTIDAILAVGGADFAFIAPAGLTAAPGVPGDFAAPACARRWRGSRRPHGRRGCRSARPRRVARGYRSVGGFDLFQLRAAAEERASPTR